MGKLVQEKQVDTALPSIQAPDDVVVELERRSGGPKAPDFSEISKYTKCGPEEAAQLLQDAFAATLDTTALLSAGDGALPLIKQALLSDLSKLSWQQIDQIEILLDAVGKIQTKESNKLLIDLTLAESAPDWLREKAAFRALSMTMDLEDPKISRVILNPDTAPEISVQMINSCYPFGQNSLLLKIAGDDRFDSSVREAALSALQPGELLRDELKTLAKLAKDRGAEEEVRISCIAMIAASDWDQAASILKAASSDNSFSAIGKWAIGEFSRITAKSESPAETFSKDQLITAIRKPGKDSDRLAPFHKLINVNPEEACAESIELLKSLTTQKGRFEALCALAANPETIGESCQLLISAVQDSSLTLQQKNALLNQAAGNSGPAAAVFLNEVKGTLGDKTLENTALVGLCLKNDPAALKTMLLQFYENPWSLQTNQLQSLANWAVQEKSPEKGAFLCILAESERFYEESLGIDLQTQILAKIGEYPQYAPTELLQAFIQHPNSIFKFAAADGMLRLDNNNAMSWQLIQPALEREASVELAQALVALTHVESDRARRAIFDAINGTEHKFCAQFVGDKLSEENRVVEYARQLQGYCGEDQAAIRAYGSNLQSALDLGITKPLRYSADVLAEIIKTRTDPQDKSPHSQPSALVFIAREDENGAFYQIDNQLKSLIKHYRVELYEVGNEDELARIIKERQAGESDLLVLAGHGSKQSLRLGAEESNQALLDLTDEAKLNSMGLGATLKKGGAVLSLACETGAGGEQEGLSNNFANMLRRIFPQAQEKGIFAPFFTTSLPDLIFNNKGKLKAVKFPVPTYRAEAPSDETIKETA